MFVCKQDEQDREGHGVYFYASINIIVEINELLGMDISWARGAHNGPNKYGKSAKRHG